MGDGPTIEALRTALRDLGVPTGATVEPAPGASGSAWIVRVGDDRFVLRHSRSAATTASRVAAMAAARSVGLPVPDVIARTGLGDGDLVLLSWLPGTTLLDALLARPADAVVWGRAMGAAQRALHDIEAPPGLLDVHTFCPVDLGELADALPSGNRLLHLDWHPLNLLVDPEVAVDPVEGISPPSVRGIIDWDNARSGHPAFDLARTHAILVADPAVDGLPAAVRERLPDFLEGWRDGYGPEARRIPPACSAWAGRVMTADRGHRATAEELAALRRWTEARETEAREVRPAIPDPEP
ncbi:MAG TPA: aminoglycoside phosphotransferase family protein [Actinopolymorphaceae bacterium]